MRRIVWLKQYSPADRDVLGGKNAGPGELTHAGHQDYQDGPAAPGRREHRHGDHPARLGP